MPVIQNFGLGRNILFDVTNLTGLTAFGTFNRLKTLDASFKAPEGVLLKKVDSITEAVKCGGVLLVHSTNKSWMMYVGKTLTDAIKDSTLGSVIDVDQASILATPSEGFGSLQIVDSYGGRSFSGTTETFKPSGILSLKMALRAFFAVGDVYALGVVTGASEGFGVSASSTASSYVLSNLGRSNGSSVPFAYMSTTVAMGVTFDRFLRSIKTAAMAEVPDAIKSYYLSTFEQAVSTFPERLSHPSVGVNTYWGAGGLITNVPIHNLDVSAGVIDGTLLSAADKLKVVPKTIPHAAGFSPQGIRTPRHVIDVVPGTIPEGFKIPLMWFSVGDGSGNTLPSRQHVQGRGVIGGLDVGQIRDTHVLVRSLGDGLRYASDAASHANLALYVNDQLDKSVVEFTAGDSESTITTTADVDAYKASRLRNSIFERGTLTKSISSFSKFWDGLAERAAAAASS